MYKLIFILLLFDTSILFSQSIEFHIDTIKNEEGYVITKEIGVFDYKNKLIDDYKIKQMYYLNWKFKGSYTVPEGLLILYYENGNIKEISKSIKGRKIGLYLFLYSNGKIKTIGYYKDIKCYSDITSRTDSSDRYGSILIKRVESFKIGKWSYYDEKGDVIKTEEYP